MLNLTYHCLKQANAKKLSYYHVIYSQFISLVVILSLVLSFSDRTVDDYILTYPYVLILRANHSENN
jgi:hypothetical protein